jgi:hypothetical protein
MLDLASTSNFIAEIRPTIVTSLYKIYINIYRNLFSFVDEEILH